VKSIHYISDFHAQIGGKRRMKKTFEFLKSVQVHDGLVQMSLGRLVDAYSINLRKAENKDGYKASEANFPSVIKPVDSSSWDRF
jgi:hypothetical protein